MGKGLQKKKQVAIKEITGRLHSLDDGVLDFINDTTKKGRIPATVATANIDESKPFRICFKDLDEEECCYEQIDSTKMYSIMEKFKQITTLIPNELFSSGLVRGSVEKNEPYKSLFDNLSPDVQKLNEIGFAGAGRIFCFNLEENFYIVSIETKHRNTCG